MPARHPEALQVLPRRPPSRQCVRLSGTQSRGLSIGRLSTPVEDSDSAHEASWVDSTAS